MSTITITCRLCGDSLETTDDSEIGVWHRAHGTTCPGKTDIQLWRAWMSVYEPGSRTDYDPDTHQPDIEGLRAVAAFGVDMALEYLVRVDQFSDRTMRSLDELRAKLARGEFHTDLTAADPETVDSRSEAEHG